MRNGERWVCPHHLGGGNIKCLITQYTYLLSRQTSGAAHRSSAADIALWPINAHVHRRFGRQMKTALCWTHIFEFPIIIIVFAEELLSVKDELFLANFSTKRLCSRTKRFNLRKSGYPYIRKWATRFTKNWKLRNWMVFGRFIKLLQFTRSVHHCTTALKVDSSEILKAFIFKQFLYCIIYLLPHICWPHLIPSHTPNHPSAALTSHVPIFCSISCAEKHK